MEENTTVTTTPPTNKTPFYVAVAVVVLVLLVGGAFVIMNQTKTQTPQTPQIPSEQTSQTTQEQPPAQTPPPASPAGAIIESVEVDYTAAGFSPASVTVKKGGTVKFVNKSGGPMSVASNPHPAHTDYPGFDQFKSSQKGQDEYDFTFEKVGTWGYHNHAKPADGGTVVVTE